MKTILVDAWNTLVFDGKIHTELQEMLDTFPNPKIILTNANTEKQVELGLVNLPYPLFTLNFNPPKTDPKYYEILLEKYNLKKEDVVYFEHNQDAVKSAKQVGITTYWYNSETRDLKSLEKFLQENI